MAGSQPSSGKDLYVPTHDKTHLESVRVWDVMRLSATKTKAVWCTACMTWFKYKNVASLGRHCNNLHYTDADGNICSRRKSMRNAKQQSNSNTTAASAATEVSKKRTATSPPAQVKDAKRRSVSIPQVMPTIQTQLSQLSQSQTSQPSASQKSSMPFASSPIAPPAKRNTPAPIAPPPKTTTAAPIAPPGKGFASAPIAPPVKKSASSPIAPPVKTPVSAPAKKFTSAPIAPPVKKTIPPPVAPPPSSPITAPRKAPLSAPIAPPVKKSSASAPIAPPVKKTALTSTASPPKRPSLAASIAPPMRKSAAVAPSTNVSTATSSSLAPPIAPPSTGSRLRTAAPTSTPIAPPSSERTPTKASKPRTAPTSANRPSQNSSSQSTSSSKPSQSETPQERYRVSKLNRPELVRKRGYKLAPIPVSAANVAAQAQELLYASTQLLFHDVAFLVPRSQNDVLNVIRGAIPDSDRGSNNKKLYTMSWAHSQFFQSEMAALGYKFITARIKRGANLEKLPEVKDWLQLRMPLKSSGAKSLKRAKVVTPPRPRPIKAARTDKGPEGKTDKESGDGMDDTANAVKDGGNAKKVVEQVKKSPQKVSENASASRKEKVEQTPQAQGTKEKKNKGAIAFVDLTL